MASTSNLASDITAVVAPYYHERSLLERSFDIGVFKYCYKAPYEGGQVIHFHKWSKLALGEYVADDAGPSAGASMDATDVIAVLGRYAQFVRVPSFADIVRFKKVAKEAYPKMRESAERTAWADASIGLREAIHGGSAALATSGQSFSALTVQYAGGKSTFAAMGTSDVLNEDEILKAVQTLEAYGAPKINGGYVCFINPWVKYDLMKDVSFKELLSRGAFNALERNKLSMWAGAYIDNCDMPLRETLGGTENTHVSSGNVVSCYVLGAEAVAYSQVFGSEGMIPRFKVQDITETGHRTTIGYHVDFCPFVPDSTFGVVIKAYASRGTNITSL